jgi:heme/copper-type cytochrome/quinol oxidase subunit 2
MKILSAIGIIGACFIIGAGVNMTQIISQSAAEGSGRSIAEVFYNAMGWGFIGLGIFCIMLVCIVAFKKASLEQEEEDEEDEGAGEE